MAVEITVPAVGESVSEAVVSAWLANEGDWVEQDAPVVVLETDKANVEVGAPISGRLAQIRKRVGESVTVAEVVGTMEPAAKPAGGDGAPAAAPAMPAPPTPPAPPAAAPVSPVPSAAPPTPAAPSAPAVPAPGGPPPRIPTPSARRMMLEAHVDPASVVPSGPAGRVTRDDVAAAMSLPASSTSAPAPPAVASALEEVVRMSPLRKRVAQRLVEAQQTAALLTTFNEVDMSAILEMRKRHGEVFLKKHGVKLGFMSFFVKAAVEALKSWPVLNAEVRGEDIVYRNYYHVGVAVGSDRGLVVPVVRGADRLGFAEVEKTIGDLAARARSGKLKLEELQGGTFTITNGGIYGSLLSTPIVNPPQSGILGMHKIEERPVARGGQVVVRPMMYLAVTYDHRIIDGREAVSFLVQIRELLEDPSRILLEV